MELTAQGDVGNRMHFTARAATHGHRLWCPGGGKPQLSIHVPSKSTLTVTLVNGNISVHGVTGDANLRSVSGNISGEVGGNLRANTATGTIHLTAPGAKSIEAKTINGDVDLKGSPSEVEVVTVSGNAKVELGVVSRGRFKTISGNVTAALSLAPDAELDGESVSGNLRFDFPAAPGAAVRHSVLQRQYRQLLRPQAGEGPLRARLAPRVQVRRRQRRTCASRPRAATCICAPAIAAASARTGRRAPLTPVELFDSGAGEYHRRPLSIADVNTSPQARPLRRERRDGACRALRGSSAARRRCRRRSLHSRVVDARRNVH